MEQARKIARDGLEAETAGRMRPDAGLTADIDKVLRLTPARDGRPDARREPGAAGRDWSAALDLIRQAAAVVRESQSHVEDVEARSREVAQRARDELRSAEARAQAAEARAQAAEMRAKEAEEWLRRLTEALHEEFGPDRADLG